jgi:peptidoglycan/xylan/chitin deacetylase (PgdA/CDA1 family)
MAQMTQIDHVLGKARVGAPKLLVVVDTEEEFDWSKPHSRAETRVDHMRHQDRAQAIFERYNIAPTYVVDYPVASQEMGFRALREWLVEGKCHIGAHLHPWVNPPFDEELSARNSYPGNLPAALEREKLRRLTELIAENFGRRPTIYRAGRYGIGPATGSILEELGYEIDTSVVPSTDFRRDGGPDFSNFDVDPFWFGPSRQVLEVPLTVAWHGYLNGLGMRLQPSLMSDIGLRLHLPGVFARLGLLERIRLTPEGASFAELKRLVDVMLAAGKWLFVFSYHSPSVFPGNTPYVRDDAELQRFLALINQFCTYFCGDCGGEGTTPDEILRSCQARDSKPVVLARAPRVPRVQAEFGGHHA